MDKYGINVSQYNLYLGISYRSPEEEFPALSLCDLTEVPQSLYSDVYSFPKNSIVYEFNRIKAGYKREGKGDGTKIMQKLVEIADEQKFYIVGGINPYGKMNYVQLQKWYSKYGFEMLKESLIVRVPAGAVNI